MSPTTVTRPLPALQPAAPSTLEAAPAAETLFPPSLELGEQLEHLEEAQVAIDRQQAEALARLRELQDRD